MSVEGDCPGCGFGGLVTFLHEDPAHPHRVTSRTDGRGTETSFEYNEDGQLTRSTEAVGSPLERTTTYEYDTSFPSLVTRVEGPGVTNTPRITVWDRDPTTGLVLRETMTGSETSYPTGTFQLATEYSYHPLSGAQTVRNPPGFAREDETSWSYGTDDKLGFLYPLARTDPLQGSTFFEYDAFNRRSAETDPNRTRTERHFDPLGRLLRETTCQVPSAGDTCLGQESSIVQHEYNGFGDRIRSTLPRGNVLEYTHDPLGRIQTVVRAEAPVDQLPANGNAERLHLQYGPAGNVVLESRERRTEAGWDIRSQTEIEYASRCRTKATVVGLGATRSRTEYLYDCNGNLVRAWDANHASSGPFSVLHEYDELNRKIRSYQPWGPSPETCTEDDLSGCLETQMAYDALDNLVEVVDAEGTRTRYEYSDRGLKTAQMSEVSGTSTYSYNEHGVLVRTRDARGVEITRTLDAAGRPMTVELPGGAPIRYTFDDAQGKCEGPNSFHRTGHLSRRVRLRWPRPNRP